MSKSAFYRSRSSAIRAARNACKRALGPVFEAYEGPDFIIHPLGPSGDEWRETWRFELRGPAANPTDDDRGNWGTPDVLIDSLILPVNDLAKNPA